MATARPYKVTMSDSSTRLIDATSPAQIERYIAKQMILSIAPASARDAMELMSDGVKPEVAEAG